MKNVLFGCFFMIIHMFFITSFAIVGDVSLPEEKKSVLNSTVNDENKEIKKIDEIDLDKINNVGNKQDECFEAIETSLTCLEEQLQRLTTEIKTLRKHVDRMKFVSKNDVSHKDVVVFDREKNKPMDDVVVLQPLPEKITPDYKLPKMVDQLEEQVKKEMD